MKLEEKGYSFLEEVRKNTIHSVFLSSDSDLLMWSINSLWLLVKTFLDTTWKDTLVYVLYSWTKSWHTHLSFSLIPYAMLWLSWTQNWLLILWYPSLSWSMDLKLKIMCLATNLAAVTENAVSPFCIHGLGYLGSFLSQFFFFFFFELLQNTFRFMEKLQK